MPSPRTDVTPPFGVLGRYEVDGDECFGVYIRVNDQTVFVDIKEDKQVESRKARAQDLFSAQAQLGVALSAFLEANPAFRNRQIAYIGLHSKDLQQGEVFWDPEGYTLLKGLSFEPE